MDENNKIISNIKYLIKKNKIKKTDRIILFGYNNLAVEIMQYLYQNGYHVKKVIDNGKKGTAVFNVKITSPERGLRHYTPNTIILIASSHYNEMKKQIIKINKKYSRKIIQVYKLSTGFNFRDDMYISLTNLYNLYLLHWKYKYFAITERKEYKLLKRNLRLKNIHKGQRCFILGNGPSLNNIDCSYLKDEIVFGVNQIMDTKLFDEIVFTYWICTDPSFFGTIPEDIKDFYKKIYKLKGQVKECFVLMDYLQYIKKYHLDNVLSFNYMDARMKYDSLDCKMDIKEEIELDKFIFTGWSVVIYCIQIAIYMGFSEIYVLGCDQTVSYYAMKNIIENCTQNYHVEMTGSDECEKIINNRVKSYGIKRLVRENAIVENQFGLLYKYCVKHNIELKNLTEPSLLEELPKDKLENIVKKG